MFTEAEVRASLVFQLSKLCSFMLKASRLATGAAPWDALVAGTVLMLYRYFIPTLKVVSPFASAAQNPRKPIIAPTPHPWMFAIVPNSSPKVVPATQVFSATFEQPILSTVKNAMSM